MGNPVTSILPIPPSLSPASSPSILHVYGLLWQQRGWMPSWLLQMLSFGPPIFDQKLTTRPSNYSNSNSNNATFHSLQDAFRGSAPPSITEQSIPIKEKPRPASQQHHTPGIHHPHAFEWKYCSTAVHQECNNDDHNTRRKVSSGPSRLCRLNA